MATFRLHSREPRGDPGALFPVRDTDLLASHLEDAAHFPGGHATTLYAPDSESAIAEILRTSKAVLTIGAQSSLTGGATPMGDTLLSTARLNRIQHLGEDTVLVQAGVSILELDTALARAGKYYPPYPTFTGATVGGTVSTNAAGAATFKYGTTRRWVEALTVVLAGGDVVDIGRGTTRAHRDGYFELELSSGTVRLDVPAYRMPAVAKLSAGYFAAPEMDLIDLFIGAEGTLGVVTDITLRIVPERPSFAVAFVSCRDRRSGLSLVRELRDMSKTNWLSQDPNGLDVPSIEYLDARCLALLREDGLDRKFGVPLPDHAQLALLLTIELPRGMTGERAYDEIGRAAEAESPDTPLRRFIELLERHDLSSHVEFAVPGDHARAAQLFALREAVPAAVNQRVGQAKERFDARIQKTAADTIVPFDQLETFLQFCDQLFDRERLDGAVWGHISDGNVHPNVIPRSLADVDSGRRAMLTLGREAIRLGGAPLAEHGVGRNPAKQQLLTDLYGEKGIDEMRRIKTALDPEWKLAPGVIFPRRPAVTP